MMALMMRMKRSFSSSSSSMPRPRPLMTGAFNRVVEQGQQLGSERLYLLFGLSAGFGRVWGKLAAEPSDLGRKLVVLSREDRYLLLGNPRTGLGLVPLLLPELCPVAPEAGCRGVRLFTPLP